MPDSNILEVRHILPPTQDLSLVPFELLQASKESPADEWPTFSLDVDSRYSFFVTLSKGVYFFSLDPWLQRLENELRNTSATGSSFRMNVLQDGPGTLSEKILEFEPTIYSEQADSPTACVVLQDSDIGYFLLTYAGGHPQAATLDKPGVLKSEIYTSDLDEEDYSYDPEQNVHAIAPARSAYQPPESFWAPSSLSAFLDKQLKSRQKKVLKDEIRLSAVTLDLMTEAHRILSQECYHLGIAASDLFLRCERLQLELRHQIGTVNDAANRIEKLLGQNEDVYRVKGEDEEKSRKEKGIAALERRFKEAQTRQSNLVERYRRLTRQVARSGGNILSEKEQQWFAEVAKIQDEVLEKKLHQDEKGEEQVVEEPYQRYKEVFLESETHTVVVADSSRYQVQQLSQDLIARAKEALKEPSSRHGNITISEDGLSIGRRVEIPPEFRKAKVDQVMHLLDREYVLLSISTASNLTFIETHRRSC